MDYYLAIEGLSHDLFSLAEAIEFIKFMRAHKRSHYEVIKCVSNGDAFFITGRKLSIQ